MTTLYDLITPGGANPAFWACPIQEGIPLILQMTYQVLIWLAGIAFFIGILTAVYYYLTAYGEEERAKKAKGALKWSVIGAVIVMLSALAVSIVASTLIAPDQQGSTTVIDDGSFVLRGYNQQNTLNQLGKGSTCQGTADAPTSSTDSSNEAAGSPGTVDFDSQQNFNELSDPKDIYPAGYDPNKQVQG